VIRYADDSMGITKHVCLVDNHFKPHWEVYNPDKL
jgi:hypothetical protein